MSRFVLFDYSARNGVSSVMAMDVAPHVYNHQFSGDLDIEIITRAARSPDCFHGTGYNIQKLFVR